MARLINANVCKFLGWGKGEREIDISS